MADPFSDSSNSDPFKSTNTEQTDPPGGSTRPRHAAPDPGQDPFGNPGSHHSSGWSSPGTAESPATAGWGVPSQNAFSAAPTTDSGTPVVSHPRGFIVAALGTALAGILFGIIAYATGTATETSWLIFSALGWVFAGTLTFILLGLHTAVDTRRQTESFYVSSPGQIMLYRITAGIAVLGVIMTAVELALWFGKAFGS